MNISQQTDLIPLIAGIIQEKLKACPEKSEKAVEHGKVVLKDACLTLAAAKELLCAGEERAAAISVPMVITIVDSGGNIKAQHRMDRSLLASIAISAEKAYTALALQSPTSEAAKSILPGQPLYGLQDTHPGKFCLFGGGIPLFFDGTCIGAVGVSGGSVEEDVLVAAAVRQKAVELGLN